VELGLNFQFVPWHSAHAFYNAERKGERLMMAERDIKREWNIEKRAKRKTKPEREPIAGFNGSNSPARETNPRRWIRSWRNDVVFIPLPPPPLRFSSLPHPTPIPHRACDTHTKNGVTAPFGRRRRQDRRRKKLLNPTWISSLLNGGLISPKDISVPLKGSLAGFEGRRIRDSWEGERREGSLRGNGRRSREPKGMGR
jgi:hypothetical protein